MQLDAEAAKLELPPPPEGYRPNVGVCLVNRRGEVFVGQRLREKDPAIWQMPQGGIDAGEPAHEAAVRELYEETGIRSARLLAAIPRWLVYDFPPEARTKMSGSWLALKGQAQRWFLFEFTGNRQEINLKPMDVTEQQEFRAMKWVPLGQTPGCAVSFKRAVYEEVAAEFGPLIQQLQQQRQQEHQSNQAAEQVTRSGSSG